MLQVYLRPCSARQPSHSLSQSWYPSKVYMIPNVTHWAKLKAMKNQNQSAFHVVKYKKHLITNKENIWGQTRALQWVATLYKNNLNPEKAVEGSVALI